MNHIARLTMERNELKDKLAAVLEEVVALETYYTSSKFSWPDNDYCHVRTDLLPRLSYLKALTHD